MNDILFWLAMLMVVGALVVVGIASVELNSVYELTWYDQEGVMANGQMFSVDGFTCACAPSVAKLGSTLVLRDIYSHRSVQVVVTDRISKKYPHRIDVTPRVFRAIAPLGRGITKVYVSR
jgi:hypothetical protein